MLYDIVLDFWFIAFKSEHSEGEWVKVWAKIVHKVKNKGGLVERTIRIICATSRFWSPVYFVYSGNQRSRHIKGGWLKKK